MSDNRNWLQEIDQALFGPAILGTDKDPERTLRRAKEAYAALVKYRGCGCDFGEDKPCPFHGSQNLPSVSEPDPNQCRARDANGFQCMKLREHEGEHDSLIGGPWATRRATSR